MKNAKQRNRKVEKYRNSKIEKLKNTQIEKKLKYKENIVYKTRHLRIIYVNKKYYFIYII